MRRIYWTGMWVALLLAGAASPAFAGSPGKGATAPPVNPSAWLNHQGPISWEALRGRLVLVEKWATW